MQGNKGDERCVIRVGWASPTRIVGGQCPPYYAGNSNVMGRTWWGRHSCLPRGEVLLHTNLSEFFPPPSTASEGRQECPPHQGVGRQTRMSAPPRRRKAD